MGAFIAVFVVIGVLVVIFGMETAKKTKAAWEEAANALGLGFSPGGTFSRPSLRGRVADCDVVVDTYTQSHGKSSTTYTRFKVGYPRRMGVGFRLTRQGFFSSFASFFGAQDVEIGDPTFDAAVVVKGPNEGRLREFLTQARRVRIQRLLTTHDGAVISNQQIEWSKRGVVRSARELTGIVGALVGGAKAIAAPDDDDAVLEEALTARKAGDLDRAVRVLGTAREKRPAPLLPPALPAPVEEPLMEAELLFLGDRREEAERVLETMPEAVRSEPAVRDWAQQARAPEPTPTPAAKGPPPSLDVASVCRALFVEPASSLEAQRIFDARFKEHEVAWEGTLDSVSDFTFDFVLGNQGGTKARFVVFEVPGTFIGSNDVGAVVAFEKGQTSALEAHRGERVRFRGRLVKVDGFMRNLFLRDGSWETS